MASTITFDTEQTLQRLLEEVHDGRLQVPEFQRELSLEDDEWIKSLLASVSLGYPIGTVMLLQAGSTAVRFDSRPIAGASAAATPARFLLDGQHRVTALYRVLMSGRSVHIRGGEGQPLARWYYLDMNAAVDPRADRDEAIISVPDSYAEEVEWEQCRFPLRLVFDSGAELERWKRGFVTHQAAEGTDWRADLMDRFDADVLEAFTRYVVPVVIVGREHTRWSVRVHGGPDGRNLSDRFSTR